MSKAEKRDQIRIRVTSVRIEAAKQSAAGLGISLSDYINLLLSQAEELQEAVSERPENREKNAQKKWIRMQLSDSEHAALSEHAKQRGWPLSKEIRWRLMSTLSARPKLNDGEISAVKGLRHAIDVVGRNINYGVRKGVIDMNTFSEDVRTVKWLIENASERISRFRKEASDRWQFNKK